MTVNASSPQAAQQNASQGGNYATGASISGGHQATTGSGGTAVALPGIPIQQAQPPGLPAGLGLTGGPGDQAILNAFAASSGFSIKQLDEQIREFNAQMALAQQQMQQIGIPQVVINQRLADAQIQFQQSQILMAQANLAEQSREFDQAHALQQQAMGLQQASITGMYNGQPTEAARQFSQSLAAQQTQFSQSLGETQRQFNQSQAQQQGQFTQSLAQQADQFNQTFGLQQDQLEIARAAQELNDRIQTGQLTLAQAQQAFSQVLQQAQLQLQTAGVTGTYNGAPTQAASEFAQQFGLQQGQLTGQYNGQPTEAARQFNQNLAQQYLTQASQFAATDPFALSDYMRGASLQQGVPQFLQNLQQGVTGGASGNVGPQARPATTLADLNTALGTGGTVNPQTDAALGAIGGIYTQGASKLGVGTLEGLSQNELDTLGQGITRLYGSAAAPAFLAQYRASRPQQTAGRAAIY
jgi:hypothetical protein